MPSANTQFAYFTCDNMTSLSRHEQAATASTACVAWLGAVIDRWRSWPTAKTLPCLCLCQWQTFWTYFVTINLLSLYLINFMFHTMLDAVGNTDKVHKNTKCDVSAINVKYTFFRVRVKISSWLQWWKSYTKCLRFSTVKITNVLDDSAHCAYSTHIAQRDRHNKWLDEGN